MNPEPGNIKTLFLLTARGGSKRIPGKNLRTLNGISLLGMKAIAAGKSRYCTRLVISTDSPEIQREACRYGIEAPFTRPRELATDTAYSVDVIAHAMTWLEQESGETYDAVMLLEPSSPFTRPSDYDNAVEMMLERDASVVVGVREVDVPSALVGPMDERGRISRIIDRMLASGVVTTKDCPQEYTISGALYLFRWDFFKSRGGIFCDRESTYGYLMDRYHSLEIDEPVDLEWAQFLIDRGLVDFSHWSLD